MLTPVELTVVKIDIDQWRIVRGVYRGMRIIARCDEIEIGGHARVVCTRGATGVWEFSHVEKIRPPEEIEKRCCRQS